MLIDKSLILKSIKEYKGFAKDSDFARYLGVSPTVLSNWYRRNTFDTNKIVNAFPEINEVWLLTGEGEMLKTPGKEGKGKETEEASNLTVGRVIPLYDAEAAAGNGYEMDMSPARPIEMIQIGGFLRESEAALRVYGSSMIPHYPPGCIVALKPWVERFIEPGAVYVVETTTNRYLKRLMYNADKTALRCVSDNTIRHEDGSAKGELCYPEFEIPVEDVRRLFRVVGVIKRNII